MTARTIQQHSLALSTAAWIIAGRIVVLIWLTKSLSSARAENSSPKDATSVIPIPSGGNAAPIAKADDSNMLLAPEMMSFVSHPVPLLLHDSIVLATALIVSAAPLR